MFSQTTVLLALATSATAHMLLNYPVPFGNATLNNSPLEPADFPCKQRPGVYDITEMNQWNAGETQNIKFMGSAVHGGGSCQFSITTDPEPTEKSQWKVIQSVVGGCPADIPGNYVTAEKPQGDAYGMFAPSFPVTMPKNIPDGRYTFAWTWINKVGNREFYMNCAPIQVGSGSGSASTASVAQALSVLPDMFVANLPNTACHTDSDHDFSYPDPGQNVVKGPKATVSTNLVGAGCVKQNKLGAGNGQIGSPSQDTPSSPGGVFAPGASSAPASGPTAQPVQSSPPAEKPTPPAAKPTSPAAKPNPPAEKPTPPAAKPVPSSQPEAPQNPPSKNPNNTTPVNSECTPCDNDGAVVCIGTKQFGLCNRGCAVAQDLAAGMACSKGVVVAATKRHIHFPRGYLHRRHSAAHLI